MTKRSSSLARRASFASAATQALAGFGEPELRMLRTFAVVVSAGGFSAAAAELQVDLSTVSKQVRDLELWLGVTLARRGRGGFVLTAEGERLNVLARQFLATMQAFSGDLAGLGGTRGPVLRLGVVDALLTARSLCPSRDLPTAMARCMDEVPGLQIQLAAMSPIEVERQLLAGGIDAGIIAARPPASGLDQHRLYGEPSSLYVAPGHAWHADPDRHIPGEELARTALVTDPYFDMVQNTDLVTIFARSAQTRADSIEAVALLVASGRFAGFLPDHLVDGVVALQSLRRVCPDRFSYSQDIVLTTRAGNVDPMVRKLIRWMSR